VRIHSRGALSTGVIAVALVFAAAGHAVSNGAQASSTLKPTAASHAQAPATHTAAQAAAKAACAKAAAAAKAHAKTAAQAKAACLKARAKARAAATAHAAPKPQTTEVTVSMFEMGFKLSKTVVPRGTVIFKVVNDGKVPHDFRIERKGTEYLDSGQSETLTVDILKPGQFTFLCTVSGHAGAGMIGTLTVK
jgi:uncharacterized cupredoxin-like copper-binding protein